jgi:uncharacterized protein YciI
MHFLLFYDLAIDYLDRRAEFRDAHLKLAWEAQERGEIVVAGALTGPADMAVLMFEGESPEVAERFAKADPYVSNGLVTGYRVRQWNTVVGEGATQKVRGRLVESL